MQNLCQRKLLYTTKFLSFLRGLKGKAHAATSPSVQQYFRRHHLDYLALLGTFVPGTCFQPTAP